MDSELEKTKNKRKRKLSKKVLWGALMVLLVGILAAALYFTWFFYNKYESLKRNPNEVMKEETAWVTEKVSALMDLPQDETPTVATVLDVEKLKDQPFFKNAQNGDKILVYTKAMKAILYRPEVNKIIEVMPLVIDDTGTDADSVTGEGTE